MAEAAKNSYRGILKATSAFGGMQLLLILINLVRGKFVAMFLGPDGMGVSSLLTTSTNTLIKMSSLGLNLAIVKEVAARKERGENVAALLKITGRLVRYTAILGCVICVLFSRLLSEWTFGNGDYAWQFVALGLMIYLTIVANGKMSVLQGLHEVKRLSLASVIGAATGLLVSVPLYYFFGTRGIVPAMIVFAAVILLFYHISLKKSIKTKPQSTVSRDEFRSVSKGLIGLGAILIAGDLIGTLATYLVNIFLRSYGTVDTVGLYQAANSITNQYTGALFAAMAMDYFPRLSAEANDNGKMSDIVNRQSEIMALAFGPAAMLIIITTPLLIKLLLTESFMPIIDMMRWMGLGILLKGLIFPMGYITYAKNNRRLFVKLEILFNNFIFLAFSIAGYYFFGLVGLGYALVADNLLCIFVYRLVNGRVYGYRFSPAVVKKYILNIALASLCLSASFIEDVRISMPVMLILLTIALAHSITRIRSMLKADR